MEKFKIKAKRQKSKCLEYSSKMLTVFEKLQKIRKNLDESCFPCDEVDEFLLEIFQKAFAGLMF